MTETISILETVQKEGNLSDQRKDKNTTKTY